SLEEIIKGTYNAGAVAQNGIFNNASQHWNHVQFWEMMGPKGAAMPSELEARIVDAFGSVEQFKTDFSAAGAGQFGSGWAWLVVDTDGTLKVTKTENGVNPLCFNQTALLGCDVWEHSYYIDFRNKRPAYLTNFLDKLVNWENVAERLSNA
ncbi:MAG: superoxide dismutase, partial [Pseudomonadota bacterium]|nr:superoxide dismutase [Pseudomonadota bacterium]